MEKEWALIRERRSLWACAAALLKLHICACVCVGVCMRVSATTEECLLLSRAHEVWSSSCTTIGMGLFVFLASLSLSLCLSLFNSSNYKASSIWGTGSPSGNCLKEPGVTVCECVLVCVRDYVCSHIFSHFKPAPQTDKQNTSYLYLSEWQISANIRWFFFLFCLWRL